MFQPRKFISDTRPLEPTIIKAAFYAVEAALKKFDDYGRDFSTFDTPLDYSQLMIYREQLTNLIHDS